MESIVDDERRCYECGVRANLELHHIYKGPKRDAADRHGLTVYLCKTHHTGHNGVHGKNGHELDIELKQLGQKAFEKTKTREEFIEIFGKSYL